MYMKTSLNIEISILITDMHLEYPTIQKDVYIKCINWLLRV